MPKLLRLNLNIDVIDTRSKRHADSLAETSLNCLRSSLNRKKSVLLNNITAVRAVPVTVVWEAPAAIARDTPMCDFMERTADIISTKINTMGFTWQVVGLGCTADQLSLFARTKNTVKQGY